jgi:hypothetical protein
VTAVSQLRGGEGPRAGAVCGRSTDRRCTVERLDSAVRCGRAGQSQLARIGDAVANNAGVGREQFDHWRGHRNWGTAGVPMTTPVKVAGRLEALSAWPSKSLIVPLTAVTASAEVF